MVQNQGILVEGSPERSIEYVSIFSPTVSNLYQLLSTLDVARTFPATTDTGTVAGLAATFGNGAMTNSMDEIEDAACLPVIGSNATEAHSIINL